MKSKEIIYEIFIKCCDYTEDIFWQSVFMDLSKGITPYGVFITKDFLCCNFKGKEFSYKIDVTKNSEILFNEVMNVLKNKFGLLSIQEKVEKRKVFDNIKESMKTNKLSWTTIRKKNIKENIIEKYILDKKEKYNLSNKQIKYLNSIILSAINFKYLSNNEIVYEDNIIKEIKGITFDNEVIYISKNIFESEDNNSEPKLIKEETNKIIKSWFKFIKDKN